MPPSDSVPPPAPEALAGLRVLELGQLLAGPFAGLMLAGFGAEVLKVEPPGTGDAIRTWRKLEDGTSLWWRSLARGKRSITCDLRKAAGRDLLRRLIADGQLSLSDNAFDVGQPGGGILQLDPFPSLGDPRITNITVANPIMPCPHMVL